MWAEIQTIRDTYQQIIQGERPWTALGDFLNYWQVYASQRRDELVKEPLDLPTDATLEQRRWAAFCAAAVEHLCQCNGVTKPSWVHNSTLTLSERWFMGLGANKPHVQAHLLEEAPEAFRKRNIYCSARVLATKYDASVKAQLRQYA